MKKYKIYNGTSYGVDTPEAVCRVLDHALTTHQRGTGQRLRLFYGAEGRYWAEENDVIGYVGRSTGTVKIPLLIVNARSRGGGAILDDCIVRIQDTATGAVLYQAEGYKFPEYSIHSATDDLVARGYRWSVDDGGGICANFKTHGEATNYTLFMTGARFSK